jgi:hypothetical protein
MKHWFIAILALLPPAASAEEYRRSIGGALSYGGSLNKDSDFRGWTLDYAHGLDSGWTFATSLAWDEETERREDKPDQVVRSYTSTFVWSHPIAPRWSAGLGVGKGLINDDNKKGDYGWVDWDKEWSVGGTLIFNLLNAGRHNINMATALEINLSAGDPQLSLDIGYAWEF